MISGKERLAKVHQTEVFYLMGELNSLVRRLRRMTSHHIQRNQVFTWYSSLSSELRLCVNKVNLPESLSIEIKAFLQTALVSDVTFFSDPSSFLCWSSSTQTTSAMLILKRASFAGEGLGRAGIRSENLFVDSTSVIWSSSMPLDLLFFSQGSPASAAYIISLMEDISQGGCFTEAPTEPHNVKSVGWLRAKNCFTFAQLLVAILELRIWRCYKKRKKLKSFLSASGKSMSAGIESALGCALAKCSSDTRLFQQAVHKKAMQILGTLTCPEDKTTSLFLSIMKKRLADWRCGPTPPVSQKNIRNLWTLHFFSTVVHQLRPTGPGRLHSVRVHNSAAATAPTKDELFRNIMSIPVMDSFSLLHEFRLLVRDELVSDHHTSELLLNLYSDTAAPIGDKVNCASIKKKSNKKRNKKSGQHFKHRSKCVVDQEDSQRDHCRSPAVSNFSEALAPRDVPPRVVLATQAMVEISHILEYVLDRVYSAVAEREECEGGRASYDFADLHEDSEGSQSLSLLAVGQIPTPSSVETPLRLNERPLPSCCVKSPLLADESSPDHVFHDSSLYSLPSWMHAGVTESEDLNGNLYQPDRCLDSHGHYMETSYRSGSPPPSAHNWEFDLPVIPHSSSSTSFNHFKVPTDVLSPICKRGEANKEFSLIMLQSESPDNVNGNQLSIFGRDHDTRAVLGDDVANGGVLVDFETTLGTQSQQVDTRNLLTSSSSTEKCVMSVSIKASCVDEMSPSRRRASSLSLHQHGQTADEGKWAAPTPQSVEPREARGRSASPPCRRQVASPASTSVIEPCLQPSSLSSPLSTSLDGVSDVSNTLSNDEIEVSDVESSHCFEDTADRVFAQGNILLVLSLTCAHMKAQAEGAVLRNIVALQRSLILHRQSVARPHHLCGLAVSFPLHRGPQGRHLHRNSGSSNLICHDLEVMSEDGIHNSFNVEKSHHVSSPAPVSSIAFNHLAKSESAPFGGTSRSPILPPPPLEVNPDSFPPLPAVYPESYILSPKEQQLTSPPQSVPAEEDFILYNTKRIPSTATSLMTAPPPNVEYEATPLPHLTSSLAQKGYRPRSASVSRRPPRASAMALCPSTSSDRGLSSSTSTDNLRKYFFEAEGGSRLEKTQQLGGGDSRGDKQARSGSEAQVENINDMGEPARLRRHSNNDLRTPYPRSLCGDSLDLPMQSQSLPQSQVQFHLQTQSAYVPLSYATYAQNMFNYGGVGGIPTPLTREILSFVERVDAYGAKMQRAKATAISRLRQVVQQLWPRAQVKAFGSYVTGLSLPSSDLDLVICLPKVHHVAGPSAPGFLEGRNAIKETWQNVLARCLRRESWVDVSSMKVIGKTAIPVIKLNTLARSGPSYGGDEDFHVSLDISFGGHGHQGLAASQLNMSLMREYPSLRLIVLVLKQFLTTRGLGEVFTGGMSSYAILLLTTRFLQELSPSTTADIGASLLGILDFYGNHLQPSVTGISVANMCYFSRHDDNEVPTVVPYHRSAINRRHLFRADGNSPPTAPNDLHRPYKFDPLFVEDPLDKGNNVGRNCFRVHQVQRMFSDVHKSILDNIALLEMNGFHDCESFSLLNLLVGEDLSGQTQSATES